MSEQWKIELPSDFRYKNINCKIDKDFIGFLT